MLHESAIFGYPLRATCVPVALILDATGSLKWVDGEKDLLDHFHRAGAGGGFHPAPLVGAGRDSPHRLRQLVDRVSQ